MEQQEYENKNKELQNDLKQLNWRCKMNAYRIERFEPPMWEEIENRFTFRWFDNNRIEYIFFVNKKDNLIGIETVFDPCIEFSESATEKDYEKACEIVRDLFEG